MKSIKLPDTPEILDEILIINDIDIEPDTRRPDRVYVREIINDLLDELPNHGILVIVKEDGTE